MTATLSESAAREAAGFTRAICLQPGDDTPRLVFADWLDEYDRPERAEFIRVQVEIERMDECGEGSVPEDGHTCFESPCRVCELIDRRGLLVSRVNGLLQANAERWVVPVLHTLWNGVSYDIGNNGRVTCSPGGRYVGELLFARGFVAEVRCDLATLLGGACGRCGGVRGVRRNHCQRSLCTLRMGCICDCAGCVGCTDCDNTGRTKGLAKALFAAHPITAVALVDLQPYHNGAGWCWFDPDRTPPYNDVPATANPPRDVYRLLTGHLSGRSRWRGYGSQAAATDALSRAAVAHCRGLAGLPPLG